VRPGARGGIAAHSREAMATIHLQGGGDLVWDEVRWAVSSFWYGNIRGKQPDTDSLAVSILPPSSTGWPSSRLNQAKSERIPPGVDVHALGTLGRLSALMMTPVCRS